MFIIVLSNSATIDSAKISFFATLPNQNVSVFNRDAAEDDHYHNNNNDDHDDHAPADDHAGNNASSKKTPQETVRARQPERVGRRAPERAQQRSQLLRVQSTEQYAQRVRPTNREAKSATVGPASPLHLQQVSSPIRHCNYHVFTRDNCKSICMN